MDNFWTAFVMFGGQGIGVFIWMLIGIFIEENKKQQARTAILLTASDKR